ncbi:hypothetical protein DFS34DRAFT_25310 [Phlyctochytrium arcticum]|nr:hypothetical protein DFS34DRAFT_25310 [Phlyctochytrium arcticum]
MLEMARKHSNISFMFDCTYKTNKTKYKLLHVVGVTGTNSIFTIAVVFLPSEAIPDYLWALE